MRRTNAGHCIRQDASEAAMSLVVTVYVPSGIAMAADSRMSVRHSEGLHAVDEPEARGHD